MAGVASWCDVGAVAVSEVGSPCLGGRRRWSLQGPGKVDGLLHCVRVVTYNRLLECMLKAIDEEANLVLFTGDADA